MKKRIEVNTSTGWVTAADEHSTALRAAILALGSLSFDQKRRVIRWVCDVFGIDPVKL